MECRARRRRAGDPNRSLGDSPASPIAGHPSGGQSWAGWSRHARAAPQSACGAGAAGRLRRSGPGSCVGFLLRPGLSICACGAVGRDGGSRCGSVPGQRAGRTRRLDSKPDSGRGHGIGRLRRVHVCDSQPLAQPVRRDGNCLLAAGVVVGSKHGPRQAGGSADRRGKPFAADLRQRAAGAQPGRGYGAKSRVRYRACPAAGYRRSLAGCGRGGFGYRSHRVCRPHGSSSAAPAGEGRPGEVAACQRHRGQFYCSGPICWCGCCPPARN